MVGQAGGEGRTVFVSAIVLAAGCATRMGGQKLLLPLRGRPMIDWVIDAALGSRATQTIVVIGHQAEALTEVLKDRPVTLVVNPDHAEGMSTSLQAGIRAADGASDAALFLLGDQPFVTSALLDRLIDRFAESRRHVVRPLVGDRPVNPVLMSAALFSEIQEQRGDVGGRMIIERHTGEVCLVPVNDPRLVLDVDSPEEYEEARKDA
jgi:molybdenum cofactor cytidylyltransferase